MAVILIHTCVLGRTVLTTVRLLNSWFTLNGSLLHGNAYNSIVEIHDGDGDHPFLFRNAENKDVWETSNLQGTMPETLYRWHPTSFEVPPCSTCVTQTYWLPKQQVNQLHCESLRPHWTWQRSQFYRRYSLLRTHKLTSYQATRSNTSLNQRMHLALSFVHRPYCEFLSVRYRKVRFQGYESRLPAKQATLNYSPVSSM